MYQTSRIIFLYTETSFHPGSGDSIVGVDLPIQRERHTDFPKNQGGGVKGALRDLVEIAFKEKGGDISVIEEIFGPENSEANNKKLFQGALSPTELRILLFPVKSLKDVFAFVTCPFVIARFQRDVKRLNKNYSELEGITFDSLSDSQILIPKKCQLKTFGDKIVLEDLVFDSIESKNTHISKLADWIAINALSNDDAYKYWRDKLRTSLVVVSDEVFQHLVVNYTEVSTRHKRSETQTVESGALWNEETLPSDTLMYASLLASDSHKKDSVLPLKRDDVMKTVEDVINEIGFIQMGASETVGQGFLAINCFNPLQQANTAVDEDSGVSDSIEPVSQTSKASEEENDESEGDLSLERSKFAWKYANDAKTTLKEDYKEYKEYVTLVKNVPTSLSNNGLGQTLAFLNSKPNKKVFAILFGQIHEWLAKKIYQSTDKKPNIIELIQTGEVDRYRWATKEAMEFITWLKLHSSSLNIEPNSNAASTDASSASHGETSATAEKETTEPDKPDSETIEKPL